MQTNSAIFDHVFGLNLLRERHEHGGINISDMVSMYVRGKTGFDQSVKNPETLFVKFGEKEKSSRLHQKLQFIQLQNRHVTKLLDRKSDLWLNTTLMGVYTDMLNLSMKNSPQDGTISDAIALKPWTMNNILVQKLFNSTLSDDCFSVDLTKM